MNIFSSIKYEPLNQNEMEAENGSMRDTAIADKVQFSDHLKVS